jgi:hypothetical protein
MIEPQSGATRATERHDDEAVDLSGDWQSEETLDLQPAPPKYDWLQEFADERAESEQARVAPTVPRPPSLFRFAPPREPINTRLAAPSPARRVRRVRIPIGIPAAGIVLVALFEVPSVNGPQLLIPWSDVAPVASAPIYTSISAPAREEVLKAPTERARQEQRPGPPPRMQPQPSPRREVIVPVVAASSVPGIPTPPQPAAVISPPPPSPAVTPAALSVKSATSLDGLLGRTVTPATLSAPPAGPVSPPARTDDPAAEEAARRAGRIAGVESVIQEYRRAFNTLNASAVRAFWPGVDVRSLHRAFDQLELQRFEFDRCRIDLAGPRAFASCDGTARSVRKVGDRNPPAQAREWTFTLGQSNDAWVILNVNSRPMQ